MNAAIISLGSESSKMLCKAMEKYFDQVDMLDLRHIEVNLSNKLEILYDGSPIKKYDCIYAKGSYKYAQLLSAITSSLSKTTYMPLTADSFSVAHDKILTQLAIQHSSVPMPTTYLAATIEGARNILKKINYPLIMKFPKGTQGKGVMYADSYASASSILDALQTLKQPFLIQEHVETGGVDLRIFVVGGEVIACMKRFAQRGEERANIHAGGMGEECVVDAHTQKIAIQAAKAIGADICAVDLLEGIKGPMVIELNVSPGLQEIEKVTERDIADYIAQFLAQQTKNRHEHKKSGQMKEILDDVNFTAGQEIITHLDFRGERILLPVLASKTSKIKETDEVTIKAEKGSITLKKFA